jgi:hypothetical protein
MDTIDRSADQLPALADNPLVPVRGMSPALQIMLDDKLFDRVRIMAGYLAKAEGFVPKHLFGKGEACFAVMCRAIAWRLDPFAVAMATYQTPAGTVGFEGKLCQAILENSGQLEGNVKFKHKGDWSKIQGKFILKTGKTGKEYAAPAWDKADEAGLGVIVSAQVKGEVEPRTFEFDLVQAYPRNSTLWATDPRTQLQYLAVRRFASSAAPGIFMGTPFDREDMPVGPEPVDVNPRPKREDFETGTKPTTTDVETETAETTTFEATGADGEVRTFEKAIEAAGFMLQQMQDAAKERGRDGADGVWESNGLLITQLIEADHRKFAEDLKAAYEQLTTAPKPAAKDKAAVKESPAPSGNNAGASTVAEGASGRETPSKEGEKINTPAKSEATAAPASTRDEAFFARKSYAIVPPKKGTGISWSTWDGYIRAADHDTLTQAEHAKIIEDNAVHLEAYENTHPKEVKALYEFFKATHARLAGGEAKPQASQGNLDNTWDE